jgi:hypothetical protein
MASLRFVLADRARQRAVERLWSSTEPPWEQWRHDPAVEELLAVVRDEVGALSSGVPPALAEFRRTRDPAHGLACVYLVQALVTAELEQAKAAGCT